MSMQNVGLKAYTSALSNFAKAEKAIKPAGLDKGESGGSSSFMDAFKNSLSKVNEVQQEKKNMITSFASGEQQNVHELMISLQKAGLAMNMTTAVRNKALEAYKELARMQF